MFQPKRPSMALLGCALLGCMISLCIASHTHAQGQALLVGVDRYQHLPDLSLQHAGLDSLSSYLQAKCGVAGPVRFRGNSDLAAQVQRSIQDAEESKRLLIYLSGYALEDSQGNLYLASSDSELTKTTVVGWLLKDIRDLLASASPKIQITLLIDCCQHPNNDSPAIGLSNDRVIREFDSAANMVAIAASGAGQRSCQQPDGGGTLFLAAVGKAINGAADSDSDGAVSVSELYRFVVTDLIEASAALGFDQMPMIATMGRASKEDAVFRFDMQRPRREVTLRNRGTAATHVLYLRHQGKRFQIDAGQSQSVQYDSLSDIEYFFGDKNVGNDGWRSLHQAPTKTFDFRLARQIAGQPRWTVGFTNSLGVQLTLIYPGVFTMGQSPADMTMFRRRNIQPETYTLDLEAELPARRVRISKPFFMGSHEVTVAAFRNFVQQTAYRTEAEKAGYKNRVYLDGNGEFSSQTGLSWRSAGFAQRDDHPAVHVSWKDSMGFCAYLTVSERADYTLPTEAQWEYAARAGTQTVYWNGNDPEGLARIANVRDAALGRRFPSWRDTLRSDDRHVYTSPIGSFPANPFGLHDMHGNVWEWCTDWYNTNSYRRDKSIDPSGPDSGDNHVIRGGCFY